MIYVHGYFGYQNCGDEAFKSVFNSFLGGSDITFTSPKSRPPTNPKKDDLLILGGGNVIDDFFLDGLESWSGKFAAIGVGLNAAEAIPRLASLNPLACLVRNTNELDLVKRDIPTAEYIPDLVFALTEEELLSSKVGGKYQLETPPNFSIKKTLAIILSDRIVDFLAHGADFERGVRSVAAYNVIKEYLKYIAEFYDLCFIAFSSNFYHPDDSINRLVASQLIGQHEKINLCDASTQPAKAISLIKQSELVLSMKFHSLVFSLIANKPSINISDAPKCTSLINDLELNNFSVPVILNSDLEGLKRATKECEGGLYDRKTQIRGMHDLAKSKLRDTLQRLL